MPTTSSESTRREVIRNILLVFAGACFALLGASRLIASKSPDVSNADPLQTQSKSQTNYTRTGITSTGTNDSKSAVNSGAYYTIKVVYFGMSIQTIGIKQEYLVLPSPVFLYDILARIKQKHAALSAMIPSMQIIVDGIPAENNLQLQDNDEVDLIPIFSGG